MFKNLFHKENNENQEQNLQNTNPNEQVTPSFLDVDANHRNTDSHSAPPTFDQYEKQNPTPHTTVNPERQNPQVKPVYPSEPHETVTSQPTKETPKTEKKPGVIKRTKRSFGEGINRAWAIAGAVLVIAILVFSVIGIVSTVKNVRLWSGKMDTPDEAGKTIVQVLQDDDFETYQKLLAADAVTANDRTIFENLQENLDNSAETIVSDFILIRLENGNQYLCSIFFDEDRNEYVIRSVQEVPLSMQNLFVS